MPNIRTQYPPYKRPIETNAHFTKHFLETTDRVEQILFVGVVQDTIAYAHHYWVATDFGSMMASTALGQHTFSALGYSESQMYQPGTKVLCYRPPLGTRTFIIGALNMENAGDQYNMSDWVHQNSACTFKDEIPHYYQTTMNPQGAIKINNAHRPVDTFPGEYTHLNVLGMGLHLGGTALFMRASELCGLWMFYNNNQLRMVSDFLQAWVGGREDLAFNDSTEMDEVTRSTPYPWDLMGSSSYQANVTTQDLSKDWEPGSTAGAVEPLQPDQEPIYRLHQFRGYLGDAERIIVSTPPASLTGVEQLASQTKHLGLSETVRHANGALTFRSAKAISLCKELLIPVPKRIRPHDDPQGDTAANYKFAGTVGSGPDHPQDEISYPEPNSQIRFAASQDMHAWLYNSYGQAGLQLHEKDWYYPQEQELLTPWGVSGEVDSGVFTPNKFAAFSNVPAYVKILVDSRPGHSHRYYRTRACIDIQDDGSILIEAGDGTSLRLGDGCLIASAMNDIKLMPGRNVELWAPRDVVLKAGNCLDGTASKGDVRLKAEKNMHMLAGNSGEGGLLLESRGLGVTKEFAGKVGTDVIDNGVTLMAKKSQVLTYGAQVYIRSLNNGDVCIDADQGNGNIELFANNRFETVQNQVSTAYGVKPDQNAQPLFVETHNKEQVFFGQQGEILFTGGQLTAPNASVWLGGACCAAEGFSQNSQPSFVSGPWTASMLSFIDQSAGRGDSITQEVQTERQEFKQTFYTPQTGIGTPEFLSSFGFSLRNDQQYGITGLMVYESRWQQAYRVLGTGSTVWSEPQVNSPEGTATMPFPGYNSWTTQSLYNTVNTTLWDATGGYDTNRRYDSPTVQSPTQATLATSYLITVQDQ